MNHTYYQETIRQKYCEFKFDKGWRLWYHPLSVLENSPQLLFMGINPGGSGHSPDHGIYSQERGCAYLVENWGSNSQVSEPVPELIKMTGLDINSAAISNFVPFRSEGEAKLKQNPNYKQMLHWCHQLWSEILTDLKPRLVISIGAIPRDGLRRVLGQPETSQQDSAVSSSNSACKFRIDNYCDGPVETVVSLPYPSSRYRLLTDHTLMHLTSTYLKLGKEKVWQ